MIDTWPTGVRTRTHTYTYLLSTLRSTRYPSGRFELFLTFKLLFSIPARIIPHTTSIMLLRRKSNNRTTRSTVRTPTLRTRTQSRITAHQSEEVNLEKRNWLTRTIRKVLKSRSVLLSASTINWTYSLHSIKNEQTRLGSRLEVVRNHITLQTSNDGIIKRKN